MVSDCGDMIFTKQQALELVAYRWWGWGRISDRLFIGFIRNSLLSYCVGRAPQGCRNIDFRRNYSC